MVSITAVQISQIVIIVTTPMGSIVVMEMEVVKVKAMPTDKEMDKEMDKVMVEITIK